MDFNAALQDVGDFGLYQKLLCIFLVVPSASLCALVYFTQFFTILVPNHRCRLSEDDTYQHNASIFNTSIPYEDVNGLWVPKMCEMYDPSSVVYISEEGYYTSNVSTSCQYGWVYDFSELYPTIATEMNWVCDNDQLPYQSQTIFYVGTSLGCIVFGLVADRLILDICRTRPLSLILSFNCRVAGLECFTNSFLPLIFRFFVGLQYLFSKILFVLSLEYIGVKKRTIVIIIWSMGYIVFSAICPWIAYGLRDWRLLCIITSAPLAAIPVFGKFVPESASWLLTQGRKKEAVKLLKTVARINKREYPEEFGERCYDKNNEDTSKDTTVLDLFRTPRLRLNNVVLAITWFVVYCCYHTNTQNASNLGTNVYDSFTYSSLVEIPALFVILFGIDWLGRRWPVAFSSLAAGIAGLIILIIPRDAIKAHLGLALIQRVTITIVYNVIMQYSAELLPTVLRGRGLAFLRLMGTLGLYLSPSIVYLSMTLPGLPLVVSGILMLLVSAFTLSLPETLHKHLPHSIEEGEMFGKNQNLLDCPCMNKSSMESDEDADSPTEKA
ncbi:Carcinine transporter like protein [Argiope bruennichi]|uniref:Carcinine transporter like protein n=1 Tax=Argiope bruennichi TaxID=94029 RepID=A0A8T0FI09_ARGBR|nr:Carcinine transporter like protein [Argiope bruennichi]